MGKFILTFVVMVGGLGGAVGVSNLHDVPSAEMSPILDVGDRVAVVEFDGYARGDVVIYWDSVYETDRVLRIAAVGGDVIEAVDSQLFVNGEIVIEPYRSGGRYDDFGPVTVEHGTYFLLGDWRSKTSDSRVGGAVPADAIRGRAVWRAWPLTRFGSV